MKNLEQKMLPLLKKGHCTPKIAELAKKLGEASTTIHYNIKKLEKDGKIKAYKAVFDHSKIDEGFCAIALLNLDSNVYGDPETIVKKIAQYPEVESIDICTGDWELVVKLRAKNQEDYMESVKRILAQKGIIKIKSLISLRQIKNEFVVMK